MEPVNVDDVDNLRQAVMILGGFYGGELARKLNTLIPKLEAVLHGSSG